MNPHSKLGLGTVQFGQAYGVSNTTGQVPKEEAARILARAAAGGVTLLDTAANYGDAEAVLAELNTAPFRIVTKTISVKNGVEAVIARARQSAQTLKPDTLLVHAAADLEDAKLWPALQALKTEGLFRKIGISTYYNDNPAALAARFKPDVMQLPFSILDQRLLADGSLKRLSELGVEVHARSLFLQGLLFMEEPPEKLAWATRELRSVKSHIIKTGIPLLSAALHFVLQRPEIAIGLVGVTSVKELDAILAAPVPPGLNWSGCAIRDEKILTPSLW